MSFSVTQTHFKKNERFRGFREQRTFDYLYDPTFTVSAEADHARASYKAQGPMDRLRKVPEFDSMFSSLPHHPRYTLHLNSDDPVPVSVDRRWRGHSEQRREALNTLAGVLPGVKLHKAKPEDVTGGDRWKFFKCPLTTFSQQIHANTVFALPTTESAEISLHRTVGVQTDYRDSETQTDPYSPEYILHPGTAPPEILTLATFMWGRGLPAGLEEVEMIERARKKRAWEATLPPLNDLTQLDKRKKMMDDMERKEWAFREQQIEKLQEARLALLTQLLQQREEKQSEATVQRLDEQFNQMQKQKNKRLQKIRNSYVLSLRKLTAKRQNVEGKLKRRDIIGDHSDYGSQTYAPVSRHGASPEQSETNIVKSHFLSTYQGLSALEAGLPASALEPRIKAPKPRESKGFTKHIGRIDLELMKASQALKDKKVRVEEKPLRFLYKVEKPVPRPPTPVVNVPPEGEEEKELAVIFLQKLIRGRSVQKQMLEEREKRLELIQELRTTHALQRDEQELLRADKQVTLALQIQQEDHESRTSQIESYLAGLSGVVLVDALDFLAKELVRLQEERRIHAFTLLAERERRLREAEESGRRQVEERRRREEDEIFKQVVKVHQATVDLYLEDVILGTIDQTADTQAREEIRHMAEELNNAVYAMDEKSNSMQSQEIVAELVYSFLIPEVHKITVRERVRQSQRRHLSAARSLIYNDDASSRASASSLAHVLEQVEEAVKAYPLNTGHETEHTD